MGPGGGALRNVVGRGGPPGWGRRGGPVVPPGGLRGAAGEARWCRGGGPPRCDGGAAAEARWCRRGGIGSHDAPRDVVLVRLPDAAG
jgi:hypothetical protein